MGRMKFFECTAQRLINAAISVIVITRKSPEKAHRLPHFGTRNLHKNAQMPLIEGIFPNIREMVLAN
ncbi:hypothetical protein TH468_15070 [Thalassospira sp. MCCC 1A03138]|nr:hypothetical protein TH468_15070 [Thalassospira sp. MCCC 1A03138]